MEVLTVAHGEAPCVLRAGSLMLDVARWAGADDAAFPRRRDHPDGAIVEALRHNTISKADRIDSPAAIADTYAPAVRRCHDRQTTALVWYYAVIP
jgi:hypothetical protein